MSEVEFGPELPDIFDVLDYLKDRPMMLRALWEYLNDSAWIEEYLCARLAEAERRLEEMEGQNARDGEPASQRPEINEEEAERAPLPTVDDEAEDWPAEAELTPLPEDNWPIEAEWAPLPEDNEDNSEMPVAPVEESSAEVVEPAVTVRELVLRTRTINIPVPTVQSARLWWCRRLSNQQMLGIFLNNFAASWHRHRQMRTRWLTSMEFLLSCAESAAGSSRQSKDGASTPQGCISKMVSVLIAATTSCFHPHSRPHKNALQ
uniref:Uncharacterized protein n=1 Tax=Onchocerca volvulus TaxID=6282 RepID=A0A8R1XSV7_ONCVO